MKSEYLPYTKQSISLEDAEALKQAALAPFITRGPQVEAFERAVAEYCDVKYAVAFSSGSTALWGACRAAGASSLDHLITSANTFIASAACGLHHQTKLSLVDIDRSTGNLDLNQLKTILADYRSTRGKPILLPVHFSGIPLDISSLSKMISISNAVIIEDAAHAFGSLYASGEKVGCCNASDMAIFSFHPAKTITTGEGGMVVTNDSLLERRLRRSRNNGIERPSAKASLYPGYYEVQELTNNYNFTDLQAALGLSQLRRVDHFLKKRRQLTALYRKLLQDMSHIRFFDSRYDSFSACHLFVLQIDFKAYHTSRTEVMCHLHEQGIGSQLHYYPIYRHPVLSHAFPNPELLFPEMELYAEQALSLPLFYDLTAQEVERVASTLKAFLLQKQRYPHPVKRHHRHRPFRKKQGQ